MIIEKPGFVTDRILFLGRKESCVYLLKGSEEFALLGGGLTYIVPDIIQLLQKSMDAAMETRHILEASYAKTKDIEKSTTEITDTVMEWVPESFMPKEIITMVIGQMIRFVAGLNKSRTSKILSIRSITPSLFLRMDPFFKSIFTTSEVSKAARSVTACGKQPNEVSTPFCGRISESPYMSDSPLSSGKMLMT